MSPRPLTAKARAFADAWGGPGTGADAARAAGYSGAADVLRVRASELLKDSRIRARITERLGPTALEQPEASAGRVKAPPPIIGALRKGKGRGTQTERIELAMALARDRKIDPKARIAALRLGAELEGELRTAAPGRHAPRPVTDPIPLAPAEETPKPGGLRLVLNAADQERTRG